MGGYVKNLQQNISNVTGEWVLQELKDLSAGGVATTTFAALPNKRLWKIELFLEPDNVTQAADSVGLRINADAGANYAHCYFTAATPTYTTGANEIVLGACSYLAGPLVCPISGEVIIPNGKSEAGLTRTTISGAITGEDNTGRTGFVFGGWNNSATITSITLFMRSTRNFKGKATLYYQNDIA